MCPEGQHSFAPNAATVPATAFICVRCGATLVLDEMQGVITAPRLGKVFDGNPRARGE